MDITFRSEVKVTLIDHLSGDDRIACAAMVIPLQEVEEGKKRRIIGDMIKGKHGSPFEHNNLGVIVEAPIFVFREWMRHRIGVSYNEYSLRYKKPKWEAYIPGRHRPMITQEKHNPMKPLYLTIEQGKALGRENLDYDVVTEVMKTQYQNQKSAYAFLVNGNVANEMARSILGVGWYSYCWVTFNLRSLIHFLSLRTSWPINEHREIVSSGSPEMVGYNSYPQFEIHECANQLEELFKFFYPITYEYWLKFHRQSI